MCDLVVILIKLAKDLKGWWQFKYWFWKMYFVKISMIISLIRCISDFLISSDAPTFSIAETTQTDHFSLSLRKLPNRNRPEPTLKSKLILQKFMIIIWPMCMDWSNEYNYAHLSNAYTLIQWVSWILNVVYY